MYSSFKLKGLDDVRIRNDDAAGVLRIMVNRFFVWVFGVFVFGCCSARLILVKTAFSSNLQNDVPVITPDKPDKAPGKLDRRKTGITTTVTKEGRGKEQISVMFLDLSGPSEGEDQ